MKFIDSNVLVYVADDTDAEKQRIARNIVEQAISSNDFLVSAQVLNEFSSVLFKKLKKAQDEVDGFLEVLEGIKASPRSPRMDSPCGLDHGALWHSVLRFADCCCR